MNFRQAARVETQEWQRRTLQGIAQLIMLGELAVNRALDNLELPG